MKLIGNISMESEEGAKNFQAIITEINGLYDIELYQQFEDGSRGDNILLGQWASSVGSAKKRINQDTGLKSNDWKWQIV